MFKVKQMKHHYATAYAVLRSIKALGWPSMYELLRLAHTYKTPLIAFVLARQSLKSAGTYNL